jgi:hypothetical protein
MYLALMLMSPPSFYEVCCAQTRTTLTRSRG